MIQAIWMFLSVYEKITMALLADRMAQSHSLVETARENFEALRREMLIHELDQVNQRNDGIANDVAQAKLDNLGQFIEQRKEEIAAEIGCKDAAGEGSFE